MTLNLILSLGLIILGFIFKAICDNLKFHWPISIFNRPKLERWWGPSSWTNCYKDHDYTLGPKFFGSTTFLIMFTSAWHFFDFLRSIAFISAFTSYAFIHFWIYLVITFVIFTMGSITFEGLYGEVFRKINKD
jgi:hypothetical protein